MQMVGSQNVWESIVKTQRRDKTPRSENHAVVSTLAIAILHAAGKTKKAAELEGFAAWGICVRTILLSYR